MQRIALYHSFLLVASVISFALLYSTRPYKDWITRASFASGYPALVLLAVTLWIGPWNQLRRKRIAVSDDLRRDTGIWAGILGIVHTIIGLCVHLRGRPWLYFVYSQGEGKHPVPLRHDLFGFANDTGALATIVLQLLLATSNDFALRALSTLRWKQLQRWNYPLFALAALHTAAYQKIEKQHISFVATLLVCVVLTLFLQGWGFQMRRNQSRPPRVPSKVKLNEP